jgi:alpha-D-xyloside xylohydrolase
VAVAAAAACLLLTGGANATPRGASGSPAISWRVTASPFRLTFLVNGAVQATEAATSGGPGGRLSYRLQDGSFHGLGTVLGTTAVVRGNSYRVATDEPGRTAVVNVTRTRTGARVSFTLQPSTGVVATFEAFATTPAEHFLGGGQRPGALDLRGQAFAVKTSYACQNTMPAPFFLSSSGYGVSLRSSAIASLAFPGAASSSACPGGATPRCPLADGLNVVQLCAKSRGLSYDLFAGTPSAIVSAYTKTVGRPQLPPASQFGLIKWRDIVGGPQELYEDVDKLHALKVPIGWVLLDNPWETGLCYGRMTFDPKFGNPRTLISSLHARGVKFMLWISPLVRQQLCPPPAQYPQSVLYGTGGNAVTIDLSDAATRSTFESSLRTLIGYGVDGFKADRADGIDLEPEQLAGGSGVTLHNLYPLLYARSIAQAISETGHLGSFATLVQAAAPGSAATLPGFWAGDQPGTFFGLQEAIHDGLSAGVAGYAVWGSDTGGYGATASAEVFVRWAQFSAVSPVFEVGGTGQNATFWNYGTPTVNAFRDAAVLHYELFPYLFELAREAHATGLPILRPLALEYPADAAAWTQDLEVLVGHDLLAAPVTSAAPTGAHGTVQAPVYLPAGSWVDLATGTVDPGGASFDRRTPLSELPLFLRAGAAIPFAGRAPLLWAKTWPTNALQLPHRGGWLYAPAQGMTTAQTAEFGSLTAAASGRTVSIGIRRAPGEMQVFLATTQIPSLVRLAGHTIARARTVAALRRAGEGWAVVRRPFPAVVLKLAPRAGGESVDVLLPQAP